MSQFAPVFFTTLNRYKHFKRAIETLALCNNADKTEVYIAFDYPLYESHWEGYRKIDEFINKINGFKKVNLIKRTVNYGSYKNFFSALDDILLRHERLVLSEDDNEFSTNFIDYINGGLEKYEDNKRIFSVCSMKFPFKIPENYHQDVYFYPGFSSWGAGIWKKKWERVDFSVENIRTIINNKENIKEIKRTAHFVLPYLQEIAKTGRKNGDSIIVYYLIKNHMYSVFPTLAKVRNHGYDGTGVNCSPSELYSNTILDDGSKKIIFPDEIITNNKISRSLEKMFSRRIWHRGVRKVKKILKKIHSIY